MLSELFQVLIFPGFFAAFVIGFLYQGIMRKVSAHMQHRVGPPIIQPFFDFAKLMRKENIQPKNAVGFLMTLCPIISFSSVLTTIIFVPIAGFNIITFPGSMFVVIYFLAMSSIFLAISGFATRNPFGKIGSIREITQMVSYEFPFIVSFITLGIITNFQITPVNSLFAPLLPFSFFGFLMGALGKLSLPPFHVPEAEQEIVAGPFTEYSGPRLAMFELARSASFWVVISMGAVLFLGANSMLTFAINSLALLFVLIVFRVIFARLRISNTFRIYWFIVGPLTLLDLARVILGFY